MQGEIKVSTRPPHLRDDLLTGRRSLGTYRRHGEHHFTPYVQEKALVVIDELAPLEISSPVLIATVGEALTCGRDLGRQGWRNEIRDKHEQERYLAVSLRDLCGLSEINDRARAKLVPLAKGSVTWGIPLEDRKSRIIILLQRSARKGRCSLHTATQCYNSG